jgi:hypothetical protein
MVWTGRSFHFRCSLTFVCLAATITSGVPADPHDVGAASTDEANRIWIATPSSGASFREGEKVRLIVCAQTPRGNAPVRVAVVVDGRDVGEFDVAARVRPPRSTSGASDAEGSDSEGGDDPHADVSEAARSACAPPLDAARRDAADSAATRALVLTLGAAAMGWHRVEVAPAPVPAPAARRALSGRAAVQVRAARGAAGAGAGAGAAVRFAVVEPRLCAVAGEAALARLRGRAPDQVAPPPSPPPPPY